MSTYFFAYGTLQPGANLGFFEEHNLNRYLTVIGKATVLGELIHIRNKEQGIDYPGLVNSQSPDQYVYGTVFEVTDPGTVFLIMDKHEGVVVDSGSPESKRRNYYERTSVTATLEDDRRLTATAYILNRDSDYFQSEFIQNLGRVPSGNWLEYLQSYKTADI